MHYTHNYLLNPEHPITVTVIGCGGTGSNVLSGLANLHEGLKGLGHPGLVVFAYDPDRVSEANRGRQKFSPSDIGRFKSEVLITRINRFYGLNWRAVLRAFGPQDSGSLSNITISCVDTVKARKSINKTLLNAPEKGPSSEPYNKPLYSMDFGNSASTGQVLLSTVRPVPQPDPEGVKILPSLFKTFPEMLAMEDFDSEPSCSMVEALRKQDLFINSSLAQVGLNILWNLFREGKISTRGAFVDVKKVRTSPIPVPASAEVATV